MSSSSFRLIAEYIWLDSEYSFRSKTRIIYNDPHRPPVIPDDKSSVEWIPKWNYDGSSCGQSDIGAGINTEIELYPVYWCWDPFRKEIMERGQHSHTRCIMVLCDNNATAASRRNHAIESFKKPQTSEPWFGIEQEYYLVNSENSKCPYGYTESNMPKHQKRFYCNMSRENGRDVAEKHMWYCISADLKIAGVNAEVGPSQWEYQIGPCVGIAAGDELMLSRYIMERIVSDIPGMTISWSPKPFRQYNGSGCHTNFSTKEMREKGGYRHIIRSIELLGQRCANAQNDLYGVDNYLRTTGTHEAPSSKEFSYGVGTRNTSVRIGKQTSKDQKGYYEDRRPGANMNPYYVIAQLNNSTLH